MIVCVLGELSVSHSTTVKSASIFSWNGGKFSCRLPENLLSSLELKFLSVWTELP